MTSTTSLTGGSAPLKTPSSSTGFYADIGSGLASLAEAGVAAYVGITSAQKTQEIAEDRAELEEYLAKQKADAENAILASRKRIVDIQATGVEKTQEIELAVKEAQAMLEISRLKRQAVMEQQAAMTALAPKPAAGLPAQVAVPAQAGVNWTTIGIAGGVGVAGVLAILLLRRRK